MNKGKVVIKNLRREKVEELRGIIDKVLDDPRSGSGLTDIYMSNNSLRVGMHGCIEMMNTFITDTPLEFRPVRHPECIPFSIGDVGMFLGEGVKRKDDDNFLLITAARKEFVIFSDGSCASYRELAECYVTIDGLPVGKKVK